MATHSSAIAWESSRTEEPGGLQFKGSQKNITPPHPLSLHPSQPPPIDFEFPCGLNGKESVCSAGDPGLIPGSGRCPGEGNDNPFQYSCLENPIDRGAWWPTVHGIERVGHE